MLTATAPAARWRRLQRRFLAGLRSHQLLLHGDLQGRNILRSAHDGWAAIDPLGLVGETAIEAQTALRDRWVSLPQEASPPRDLLRQLRVR